MANDQSRTILVATDGSKTATQAVQVGLRAAEMVGASVRFVHASSPLEEQLIRSDPAGEPSEAEIRARDPVLDEAAALAEAAGVSASVELLADPGGSGDLAAAIAGIAEGIGATMIVVGSRGRGTATGAVLGSVSHNLIRYATVPVLVCPAGRAG